VNLREAMARAASRMMNIRRPIAAALGATAMYPDDEADAADPMKTMKAYKLFRTLKDKPGELYPLFIGKKEPVPIGEWVDAQHIPTKGFAERPGWHAGTLPKADHLMKKDGTMQDGRVWAEVELPADKNWQQIADTSVTKDIKGMVPEGGYYRFPRPLNQGGEWLIGGSLKVNKQLTEEEVRNIIDSNAKKVFGGAGLVGAASLYSPEAAQARQYKDRAEEEGLEDAYSPFDMIQAATGGGGLTLRAARALIDPVINYGIEKFTGK